MSLEYLTDVYNKILIITSRLRTYVMISKVDHNILVSSLLVLLSAHRTKNTLLPLIILQECKSSSMVNIQLYC